MYSLIKLKVILKYLVSFVSYLCKVIYAFPIFSMHFSSLSQKILLIFQSFQFWIFFNPHEEEEKDRNLVRKRSKPRLKS